VAADGEVIDCLGAGGRGDVYRARDTRLGRTVVLNVPRPDADPDEIEAGLAQGPVGAGVQSSAQHPRRTDGQ
jgi:hypothetical protein